MAVVALAPYRLALGRPTQRGAVFQQQQRGEAGNGQDGSQRDALAVYHGTEMSRRARPASRPA